MFVLRTGPMSRGAARGMVGASGNGVYGRFSLLPFLSMFGLPLGVAQVPTGS